MIGFGAGASVPVGVPGGRKLDEGEARRVRLVGLDVDGVLTNGGIYLGDVDGARH